MEIFDYLSQLISFNTTTENIPEIERSFMWVKNHLKSSSLHIRSFYNHGQPSLIITSKNTKTPKLLLTAHIDVVPGGRGLFKPKISRGRIFGRGVFDMKYAIACYLYFCKQNTKILTSLDIGILITSDEEKGGSNGTAAILKSGLRPKVCFLPDGGADWHLEVGAKGVLQIKLAAIGKSAHSSKPWLGVNAIDLLYKGLEGLKSKFPKEPCGNGRHAHNTISINKILAGQAINSVAEKAAAYIDMRFCGNKQKLKVILDKICLRMPGLSWTTELEASAFNASYQNKYLKLFRSVAKQQYSINCPPFISHGTCDARYFSEYGIPTVVLRPKGGGHHSNKEWLDVQDLKRFYNVMEQYIYEVCGGKDDF